MALAFKIKKEKRSIMKKQKMGLVKWLTLVLFALISTTLSAQDKRNEVGLYLPQLSTLPDLDNIGFIYKKDRGNDRFIRFKLATLNASYSDQPPIEQFDFFLDIAVGHEKRVSIDEKVSFVHGFEPQISYARQVTKGSPADPPGFKNTNTLFRPQLGYIIGVQYSLSDSFYFNIETVPAIGVDIRENDRFRSNETSTRLTGGFNSSAVALTVAYRFKSKQ